MSTETNTMSFVTGAVRSKDVQGRPHHLITPIGLAAVARVYVEPFDDEFLDDRLEPKHWVGYAKKFTYEFLENGDPDSLAFAAACVLEAIAAESEDIAEIITHEYIGCGYEDIPITGLRAVVAAYAEGAVKYSAYNWEKGMPVSDLLDHGIEHLDKWLLGDTSEPHLGHAGWNWLAALHSLELWPHLNGNLRGPGCKPPVADPKPVEAPLGGKTCDRTLCAECLRESMQGSGDFFEAILNHVSGPFDIFDSHDFPVILAFDEPKPTGIPALDDYRSGRGPAPVLYVSGPMSGIADYNFPLFNSVSEKLRQAGYPVLNPADFGADAAKSWSDNLHRDLWALGHASVVVTLPGWEESKGACLEIHTARSLGKGVVELSEILDF